MARTGLETPPGISLLAWSKSLMEESKCIMEAFSPGRLINLTTLLITKTIYIRNYYQDYISIMKRLLE